GRRHRDARGGGGAAHADAERAECAGGQPQMKPSPVIVAIAVLGFVFLYAPIISLVVFSLNESRMVTVWGGFSTKWYAALFSDPSVLRAGLLSLQIAAISASIALVSCTRCAVALVRF